MLSWRGSWSTMPRSGLESAVKSFLFSSSQTQLRLQTICKYAANSKQCHVRVLPVSLSPFLFLPPTPLSPHPLSVSVSLPLSLSLSHSLPLVSVFISLSFSLPLSLPLSVSLSVCMLASGTVNTYFLWKFLFFICINFDSFLHASCICNAL